MTDAQKSKEIYQMKLTRVRKQKHKPDTQPTPPQQWSEKGKEREKDKGKVKEVIGGTRMMRSTDVEGSRLSREKIEMLAG
jgi:hypothetical protein